MALQYKGGDLLAATVEAVVNTVNTRGVMGKGIALQVKQRWPEVDREYRAASKRGEVTLGRMHVVERGGLGGGPRFVINFPTKDHWRSRSRLSDIEAGLDDLRGVIERLDLHSIAVPPLGCGNGGLAWVDVRPLIESALGSLNGVEVVVYPPEGAPDADAMLVGTPRPNMTPTLASLIRLIAGYWTDVLGVTDIEIQKLAYFVGVRRPDFQLRFVRGPYGPYCEPLHHVLRRAEGHYLRGYGDRSRRPWEPGPLTVLDDAADDAAGLIAAIAELASDLDAVERLTIGFEGAWGMELLSTVHWVASEDVGAQSPTEAWDRIGSWSMRKNRIFPPNDIDAAWAHLDKQGWLEAAPEGHTLFDQ